MESDIEMLRRYRETGDRRFLSALFERHRRLAYCVAYRVVENAADTSPHTGHPACLQLLAAVPNRRLQCAPKRSRKAAPLSRS